MTHFFWHETLYCHVPSQVEPRATKKERFSFSLRLENRKKKKSFSGLIYMEVS